MVMEASINEELTLAWVAQMMQDFYYKELKTESDFLEEGHFVYCARAVFGKLMDAAAKESQRISYEVNGFYTVELSQDWLVSEEVEFEEPKNDSISIGKLSQMPYSFPYDTMGYAVQNVELGSFKEAVRISPLDKWKFAQIESANRVFYFVRQNIITLIDKGNCKKTKATVWFAPSLQGDPEKVQVPLGMHMDIVTYGVKILREIAETIVDKTNNQNPNKIIESEIDNSTLK